METRSTYHTYTSSDVMVEYYDYVTTSAGAETSYVSSYKTTTVGDYDVTYTYQYDINGNIKIIEGSDGTRWGYIYDSRSLVQRKR